jgi:hypothetical protein
MYLWRKNWIVLSNVVQEENLPLCPNGIDFVDKDNGWGKLINNTKEFSHQLGPSPKYFCISSLPTTRKNVANVEFATACSKFQPQVFTFRLHLMHWCQ